MASIDSPPDVMKVAGRGDGGNAASVSVAARPEAVDVAATGASMTDETADEALAWLLSDEGDPDYAVTKALTINIGGHGSFEKRIPWTIKAVDRDMLRQMQKQAQGNRRQRRGGAPADIDSGEANTRIVAAGTVKPDLALAAKTKGIAEAPDPLYAPMQIVKHRFRDKPGLIDQLAGEILDLSGYDDDDVQDAVEVKAAGN